VVPKIKTGPGGTATPLRVTWEPETYERAAWESTGLYDGGAIAHAWGTETGWFEYTYEVVAPAAPPRVRRGRDPYSLTLRARVSSEFPGSSSPPDGTSPFEVTLDGYPVGAATAPRDDGRGAWLELRTGNPDALHAAVAVGKHKLRFTVPASPKSHGLCIYGKPGQKGGATGRTGPIELRVD
jgi:hypothetical protein